MKIIGHRGSAGNELENTLASVHFATTLDIWAIEFDVHKTKDGKLVLMHDGDLHRVSDRSDNVKDLTLKQLQKIPLITGSHIPTLQEALEVIEDKRTFIEIKAKDCGPELIRVLKKFPEANVTIASFKHDELAKIKKLNPNLRLYGLERTRPFDIILFAKELKLDGVGLYYWILNPLTYFLALWFKLEVYVYTVDSPFVARFISFLYPKVQIVTNYPARFIYKDKKS